MRKIGAAWTLSPEKRLMDITLASVGIVMVGPAAVAAAGVIYVTDGDSPIFTQDRIGRGGLLFRMRKLRTMPLGTPDTPSTGHGDSRRTNQFASLLSALRLDEAPQLTEVLAGRMTMVGPRPLLPSQHEEIMDISSPEEQAEYL